MRKLLPFLFLLLAPASAHAVDPAYTVSCVSSGFHVTTQSCGPLAVNTGDTIVYFIELADLGDTYNISDTLGTSFSLIRQDTYTGSNVNSNDLWCGVATSTGADTFTGTVTLPMGKFVQLMIVNVFSNTKCPVVAQNVTNGTAAGGLQFVNSTALSTTQPNQMLVAVGCAFGTNADFQATTWQANQTAEPLADTTCDGSSLLSTSIGSYQAPYRLISPGAGDAWILQFVILPNLSAKIKHGVQEF